jgi:hypothetical protein
MAHKGGLALVLLGYLLLAIVYARVVPPLEGFDALAHFGYAAYLHQERRLPVLEPEMVRHSYELIAQPPLYFAAIALATAPLPMERAMAHARNSDSPYHEKSMSQRQTLTLPAVEPAVVLTLWVARSVSILGGLFAVICTFLLLRELLPSQPGLAVAVASIVGFNPQFLFSSVTITNDAWAPAMLTAILWLLARHVQRTERRWWLWLLTGAVAGLAALTKYSCLLVAVPGLLLFYVYWRRAQGAPGWRQTVNAGCLFAAGGILVAGFWYFRNLALYGQLVPLEQMAIVLPTMRRAEPKSLAEVIETIPWLLSSYWGVFVSIIAPPLYLNVTHWLLVGAVFGLLFWCMRTFEPLPRVIFECDASARGQVFRVGDAGFAVFLAVVWFAVIFAGVLHWTRTIEYGEQGRLIHAAAPAFALLLLLGWRGWLPKQAWPWLDGLTPILFVGMALWPLPTLRNNYDLPPPVEAPIRYGRELMATFEGGMRLLGVDLPAGAALAPGERLPLALYFTTNQVIPDDYTLFLHLADDQNNLLYQFDGVPVRGRHPPRQWTPGAVFVDRHSLAVQPVITDTLATLSLGFYHYTDIEQRQSVSDRAGNAAGDRLILGYVRVLAQQSDPPQVVESPLARWQQDVQLLSFEIQPRPEGAREGAPQHVQLTWQATAPVQTDYTVFVQWLDGNDQVLAQVDRQPQEGRAPTSTWRKGDTFTESYELDMTGAPSGPGGRRLIVGLYDPTGRRLILAEPGAGQDYFVLQQKD